MTLIRARRLGALLTLAIAASIGSSSLAQGQATKTETKTKAAKQAKAVKDAKAGPVDLNSATMTELQTLPGVGEVTARKIIDSRPHKAVTDLAGAGVSAAEIEKLKPLVEVKPLPAPIDVNTATAEKLQELPGIGPAMAREIVAARPLTGYDSVAKLKGIGPEKLDALKGRLKFAEEPAVAKTKAVTKEVTPAARTKVAEVKKEEMKAEAKAKTKVAEARTEEKAKPKLAPGTKVNINTANLETLQELFGIGPVKAQAIIDYRKDKKFEKIEDVMQVRGIKEGEFSKIKDQITVK